MYIYNNSCGINNDCVSGYSLYFPCVGTINRGENVCFDFYIVDNVTKQEVDLREVEDITLNISGRYNCNFGSYSYPENIKSLQVEKFSNEVYDIDFDDILNKVNLYIDIVDENHDFLDGFIFDEKLLVDIAIEGSIGYFLDGSDNIVKLKGHDTDTYMFLGWSIDESDEECNKDNFYDYLINNKFLTYNIVEDCTVRAVYQKRRQYTIRMANDNYNSSFVVEYMGKKITLREGDSITALEGHDIKVSCIPNDVKPYKFVKWSDGYKNPYRIITVGGDDLIISLKAQCSLNINDDIEYIDNIDASLLNNFKNIYPEIREHIYIDDFYIDNIYINNCEIDVLNETPYIKIINGGYMQIININETGNLKLSINNIGSDCEVYIDKQQISSSSVEYNDFLFEFEGGIITITGNDSCVFGLTLNKEVIYNKGKCMFCLSSEDTLKLHPGDLVVDGGVIVNGNPYGLSPVNFARVTNITPLIIKQ